MQQRQRQQQRSSEEEEEGCEQWEEEEKGERQTKLEREGEKGRKNKREQTQRMNSSKIWRARLYLRVSLIHSIFFPFLSCSLEHQTPIPFSF